MEARRSTTTNNSSLGLIIFLLLGVFVAQSIASFEDCFALCFYECMQSGTWKPLCYPKCGAKCVIGMSSNHDNQLNGSSRKIHMKETKNENE
ncbi:hypothetical protein LINPERPRIM_LOCUS12348 [Linum perenne]